MMRCLRRLLVTTVCTLLVLSAWTVTAEASVARVAGVSTVSQDWYHAKLKIRWYSVSGASYQVRWGSTLARMRAAKPVAASGTSTYVGPLNRGITSYVQVRAVRHGSVGAWSRARGVHFRNRWPSVPVLSGHGVPGGVRFTWTYTPNASRYRVQWSAAPYGKWPGAATFVDRTVGAWISQYARGTTFTVPATPHAGDRMLGVAYANPVFGRLEANNAYLSGATRRSPWRAVFPAAPNPGTGDALRLGTYNVMLFPTGSARVTAIARNISTHALDIVALQEANSATAGAVLSVLGSGWAAAPSGNKSAQQILYRTAKYHLSASGVFNVPNPKTPATPLITPWAHLVPVAPASPGQSQSFYVVSAHFAEDPAKTQMQKKHDAGLAAQAAMAAINGFNDADEPVIVAGDLRYLREPFGDVAGYVEAPPTFVRGGYYDAMAALRKTGYQYTTVNAVDGVPGTHQTARESGVGSRSDYIMLKGFKGSRAYVNVYNWAYNGLTPSDHNLVYADLTVPFLP